MAKKIDEIGALRHTAEHVLHTAMQKLYPSLKKAMGPAIDNGFYFDFEVDDKISEADFEKIEKEMQKLIDLDLPMVQEFISVEEAKKLFKDNPYKLEWLLDIEKRGEKVSTYKLGDLDLDLCSGPHAKSTGEIKAFKLLKIAGAYWHGDEKNKMLTRIYGTAFFSKEELEKYLWQLDEAEKRDHRKIASQLDLYSLSDLVGAGLPLFAPKGALIRRLVCEFVEELQSAQDIYQVWTPQIAKAELFKKSGHYDKYNDSMFHVRSNYSEEEFFLKPMNCPQHTQIFASQQRSYRDLPIRYADFAMLYRDEKPGELMGLARTRSFSQDDCHIFCREDQVVEEMNKALDMTKKIMETYGFSYKYRFSTRDPKHPEKYLGDPKNWDKAEKISEEVLKKRGIEYILGPGEAAFYAPKLDLIATDSIGREWQLSTLQIDFVMPERFGLVYVDDKGQEQRPVMLHRAIMGSPERFMAILIEHFAGAFPVWLSPVQVQILPIADRHFDYAKNVEKELKEAGVRVELDERSEKLGAKIRDAQMQKMPYMIIVGDKELEAKKVAVRKRSGEDLGSVELQEFIKNIKIEIIDKAI